MTIAGGAHEAVAFRLDYDDALVRRASRAFLRRATGRRYLMELIALVALAAIFAATGTRDWLFACFVGLVVVFAALPVVGYALRVRQGLRKVARVPDRVGHFRADAEGFQVDTALGQLSLCWPALHRAWLWPDLCLLLVSHNEFVSVPLANATADDVGRLVGMLRAAGVRID